MCRRCSHRVVLMVGLTVGLGCSITGMVDRMTGEDASREVRETGLPALATVLEIHETGVKVNDDPVVGFRLEVTADGRVPWTAETRALVSLLAIPRIQPGAVLPVRYDPADPSRVALVMEDEPRVAAEIYGPAGPVMIADDMVVELLADGVWLHTSYIELESYGNTPANGLVVVAGREAALIDTPWTDDQTRRLIEWVAVHEGVWVSTVVATHSHQDCLGGLAAAHLAGSRSYGSMRTAELAREAGVEAPQTRFSDRLEVQLGERVLELSFVGPGHTEDTIVVWLPDVEVLFGGCLVRPGAGRSLGYTAEADLERWPATIEALQAGYGHAQLIVPGHGRPGGQELLTHTLELLRAAR